MIKPHEVKALEEELFRLCRMRNLCFEHGDFLVMQKLDKMINAMASVYVSIRCDDIIFINAKKTKR